MNDKFNDKASVNEYNILKVYISALKRKKNVMTPAINKVKTGLQIRLLMDKRGITVNDVRDALSLGCSQSVYHWLNGQSLPTLDNLYALSELLKVPMDMLVCGNRQYDPKRSIPAGAERLFRYYMLIQGRMAA